VHVREGSGRIECWLSETEKKRKRKRKRKDMLTVCRGRVVEGVLVREDAVAAVVLHHQR
jgi:hypothetical protein